MLLDVLCLVLWFKHSGMNLNQKSGIKKTSSRPPKVTTLLALWVRRRKNTIVAQLTSDHHNKTQITISATTVRCVCPFKSTAEKCPFTLGKRARYPDNNRILYSSQTSTDLLCRVIQIVCWSGENNVPHKTNVTLLKDMIIEECRIMVWTGISLGIHTDRHVCHGRMLTVLR